ncbi:carboxylic ester hydrolase [Prorops nasuta]|uniref:carboxylic ester hydrolase n=1 Tax=Prorops nasuta TaxID=863751 RepID=UPI0034CDF8D3
MMLPLFLAFFLTFGSLWQSHSVQGLESIVEIKNGTLAGIVMRSRKGREFLGFRGIPYALPPLGELRFEPPKPAASWTGVLDAGKDSNICTQRNIYTHQEEIVGHEDCLYLNVYTPKVPGAEDKLHPVMIWFHGGGWLTGAGHSEFYGPKFLLDHDMVLVTLNFRLGPLGFISMEDMVIPGNMAMKDQAQGIRWVSENIAAFGGDPNRVTIFGESAGGASVHYHMISHLSRGLFHRGISQSGTAYCPWTLTQPGEAKKHAKMVAEKLKCPSKDSKAMLKCLKTKSAVDIIGTDRLFQEFDYCPMIPFRPVVEPKHSGAFLSEDPFVATTSGNIVDIPWMAGITSEEGSLRVPGLYGLFGGKLIKQLNDEFTEIAPISLLYKETCPAHLLDDVTKKIREFYFGDRDIDTSTKFSTINMYSDAWFTHGASRTIRDYFKQMSSPLYYYYFAYKGSASFSRIFGDPSQDYGVSHADDLQYLFPVGEQLFQDTPLSQEDHKMIDSVTSLWFNFAKSGNPTPDVTSQVPVKWKPVRTESLEYLHIGNDGIRMSKNLLSERLNFWDTLPIRDGSKRYNDVDRSKDEL